jgi:hypothetical protein
LNNATIPSLIIQKNKISNKTNKMSRKTLKFLKVTPKIDFNEVLEHTLPIIEKKFENKPESQQQSDVALSALMNNTKERLLNLRLATRTLSTLKENSNKTQEILSQTTTIKVVKYENDESNKKENANEPPEYEDGSSLRFKQQQSTEPLVFKLKTSTPLVTLQPQTFSKRLNLYESFLESLRTTTTNSALNMDKFLLANVSADKIDALTSAWSTTASQTFTSSVSTTTETTTTRNGSTSTDAFSLLEDAGSTGRTFSTSTIVPFLFNLGSTATYSRGTNEYWSTPTQILNATADYESMAKTTKTPEAPTAVYRSFTKQQAFKSNDENNGYFTLARTSFLPSMTNSKLHMQTYRINQTKKLPNQFASLKLNYDQNFITKIDEVERGGKFQRLRLVPADTLIECKENDFGLECSCSITLSPPKCKQLINSFLSSCRILGCKNNGRCINMAYKYPS